MYKVSVNLMCKYAVYCSQDISPFISSCDAL